MHRHAELCVCVSFSLCECVAAVNVSVPEEMDAKLTKDIIEEYGLKASASMVSLAELSGQIISHYDRTLQPSRIRRA